MDYSQSRDLNARRLKELIRTKDTDFNLTYPSLLSIEPSSNCNAQCPLCPTGTGELGRSKTHLKLNVFKSIVDEVAPYTSKMNLYNYGEPFLNPSIYDMFAYANQHNVYSKTSTNGTCFYHDKWIKDLVTSGLDELIVSLDGADAETYNQYRVGIPFQPVVDGLYKLRDYKRHYRTLTPKVRVQMLAMRHNQHQAGMVKEIAIKAEAEFVVKSVNFAMVEDGFSQYNLYAPSLPEMPNRYEKDHSHNISIKHTLNNVCHVVWTSMMINADGSVNPCCYDYRSSWILGQLPQQTVGEIWRGPTFTHLRQQIRSDISSIPICRTCPVATYGTPEYSTRL